MATVSSGFSKNVSISSPTQKTKSAFCSILACEGFRVKLCGELLPSTISFGAPTPSINKLAKECIGFMDVTTCNSALACEKPKNRVKNVAKRNLFIKFFMINISFCCYNITCYNITLL